MSEILRKIDEIHARGNLPVVVGGTMYFLQHLLIPGRLVSGSSRNTDDLEEKAATSTVISCMADLDPSQQQQLALLPAGTQRMLFQILALPPVSTPNAFPPNFPLQELPTELQSVDEFVVAMYKLLVAIDPLMAQKWHWRDIRKVTRSLQVFLQTGQLHSSIIAQQAQEILRPQ